MTTRRYGLTNPDKHQPDSRGVFPAQSTVLDELKLGEFVAGLFPGLAIESCRFYMRGDGDIYRVRTDGPDYYLKAYRPPHTENLAEAEARYVNDLAGAGLPVVRPVRSHGGCFACSVTALEGLRPLLMFEAAPPDDIPLGSLEICRELGCAIASLHHVSDSLQSTFELPVIDPRLIAETKLPFAEPYLEPGDYAFLQDSATRVSDFLDTAPRQKPGFGLCHADLVMSNLRFDPALGVTFFDFGNASYTWRHYDISVAAGSYARQAKIAEAQVLQNVQDGYSSVRKLPPDFGRLLPAMQILRRLGWIGGNAATLPLRLGTDPLEGDIFTKPIQFIRDNIERSLTVN